MYMNLEPTAAYFMETRGSELFIAACNFTLFVKPYCLF